MPDSVYKKVDYVGTSSSSISDAINNAIAHASATEKVTWFEVMEMRGHVEEGKVTQYQVIIKVGFRVGP